MKRAVSPWPILVLAAAMCLVTSGCADPVVDQQAADQRIEEAKQRIHEQLKVGYQQHAEHKFQDVPSGYGQPPGGLGLPQPPANANPAPAPAK